MPLANSHGTMDAPRIRHASSVLFAALAALVTVLAAPGLCSVDLPRVADRPDLSWKRQPLFRTISRWDVTSLLPRTEFPEKGDASPADEPALRLYREAREAEEIARRKGFEEPSTEAAARLYLQAHTAFGKGDRGLHCLSRAARLFFLAGRYLEAEDLAGLLIRRSAGPAAYAAYFLLKGESLLHRGNFLTARECFRQAASGRWDPGIARKLSLRIADASYLLGNMRYASTLYRRILRPSDAAFRSHPEEAIRLGDALLQAGDAVEALAVFRSLQNMPLSRTDLARAALGEGDSLLILNDPGSARLAYRKVEGSGASPDTEAWLRCRLADLEFLSGSRKEAAAQYRAVSDASSPDVSREARYKWILCLFLLGDYEELLRVVGESYSRNEETPGAANIRRMAAEAGTSLVRSASTENPARFWTVFQTFLFSFSGSPMGNRLYGELGSDLESKRIWPTASILYQAAGRTERRETMRRIASLERAYFRDPPEKTIRLLDSWSEAEKVSPEIRWLAAKAYFRAGRYRDSLDQLKKLESADSPSAKEPFPRHRELAAYISALQGNREHTRSLLADRKLPAGSPGLSYLNVWASESPAGDSGPSGGLLPETGSDPLWETLTTDLKRYRRAISEKDG
ncbi:MAG: hypothetical protein Kow00128_00490 [Deltaproteobacteria bacterium]